MSVTVAEDRSMCVQPHQVVRTAWIDIDSCKLGFRLRMNPEAVEKKFRRLLNLERARPGRRSSGTGRANGSLSMTVGTTTSPH